MREPQLIRRDTIRWITPKHTIEHTQSKIQTPGTTQANAQPHPILQGAFFVLQPDDLQIAPKRVVTPIADAHESLRLRL